MSTATAARSKRQTTNMQIRKISEDDFDAWTRMVTNYDPDIGAARMQRAWYRFFAVAPQAFCMVAVEDSQPIAFMQYTFHAFPFSETPVCYMDAVYTQDEYRGRGIASALIGYLTEMGRIMGWGRIYWVTEPNNPARSIYDKIAKPDFIRYHMDL